MTEEKHKADEEAIRFLTKNLPSLPAKDQDFGKSLTGQFQVNGDLSKKQWYWVHKLVEIIKNNKAISKAKADVTEALTTPDDRLGSFAGVVALLKKAAEKLKWPRIRLQLGDGSPVMLRLAGPKSKFAGCVNVTDGGPYGKSKWYGRVNEVGMWTRPTKVDSDELDAVEALLMSVAHDPVGMAQDYGRMTGNCCFCGKGLTDPKSTEVGYGPVCAGSYGLAWGE